MAATVGQGSASSRSSTCCPLRINPYASVALLKLVNSLMSAPAMNPLFFAERTTTPRGGSLASGPSGVFMRAPVPLYFQGSSRGAAGHGVWTHSEVADERTMIGEAHVRNAK